MGHAALVLVVFEAEHDAVDADGHAAEDDGNLQGELLDVEEGEYAPDDEGDDEETDDAHGVGEAAAEHGAPRHRGQCAADDDEGNGDGHIAYEMEEAADEGRRVELPESEDDGQHGSDDAGGEDTLRFDGALDATAANENLADGVHQKVEGDGEDDGVEECPFAEDGADGGETDEGNVAEGRHELQLAHHVLILRSVYPELVKGPPHAADEVSKGEDDGVDDNGYPHDAGYLVALEDKAVAHDAGEDEHGGRDIEDEVRHLFVEVGSPEA